MPTVYPGASDNISTTKTDSTAAVTDHAAHHDLLASAVNAIELATGRLDRVVGSMYRAADYSVPLNSTNTTPCDVAINAFLTTLRGLGKPASAFFDGVDFWIANPLILSTVSSYLGLYGALGCRFRLTTGAPRAMLQIGVQGGPVVHDFIVDGIEWDGNGANITGTTGSAAIICWDAYRVRLRDCYLHDTFNSGSDFNQCGDVKVTGTDYDNCGIVRKTYGGSAGANAISIYQTSPDMTNYPSEGFEFANLKISHVADVGLDATGDGSAGINLTNVKVYDWMAGNVGSGWGLGMEVEPGDTHHNTKYQASNCSVERMNVGLNIRNTGNATYGFKSISLANFCVDTVATAIEASGNNLSVVGGVWQNVQRGVHPNGPGRNWSFTGITGDIDPASATFGKSPFNFIVGNDSIDQVLVANCTFQGASAISDSKHAGILTWYNGTGLLTNFKAVGNSFRYFQEGASIQHNDICQLADNDFLDSRDYGVDQSPNAKVYGHGGRIAGFVTGAIHTQPGSRWGALGNNGWVGGLMPTPATTPSRIPWRGGGSFYIHGCNMAWLNYGQDFGGGTGGGGVSNTTNSTTIDGYLASMQSAGMNAVRWWVFSDNTKLNNGARATGTTVGTVTAASWVGGVATYTVGAGAAAIVDGQSYVTVTGVTPSGYNISKMLVTSHTGTTVTVNGINSVGTYTSGGTMTTGPDAWVNTYFVLDANGYPIGLQPNVLLDFDAAMALLKARNMRAIFSLFNHAGDLPQSKCWNDATGRQALMNCLNILFARYREHPALLGWELGNEWDSAFSSFSPAVNLQAGYALIAGFASAVHAASKTALAAVTCGSAAAIGTFIGLGLDYYGASWYNANNGGNGADYNMGSKTAAYYQSTYKLDAPVIVAECMVDFATNSGLTVTADTLARYNYFYNNGFAGCWGWSATPSAADGMRIDWTGATNFTTGKLDLGPGPTP